MSVQRLSDNSVDKEALLESMQSDKTALSRAIAQNKELKIQLAELQNGFVKMVKQPAFHAMTNQVALQSSLDFPNPNKLNATATAARN